MTTRPTPILHTGSRTPDIPGWLLDATPGLDEARTALDAARDALAAVRLEYPEGVRPLEDVGIRVDAFSWKPAPTVPYAEFDAARVAREVFDRDRDAAQRALNAAVKRFEGRLYGHDLTIPEREARQRVAVEHLAAIDDRIEHEPMTGAQRDALGAERVLAERYALAGLAPGAIGGAAVGGVTTVTYTDGEGVTRTVVVTPHSAEVTSERRITRPASR
ncbi:hypothetical protein [Agromyces kandeliae]|uniref:Uncharacterized protein n=1 Tax=Agromyces kandeliae TaxID=2666141 RepID=A0A6L5QYS9_9MICO|nr:hypothetical protein [Agromyces kandeliae]MRX42348.1 hypothetical protein [Agromyces kandeliae]